VNRAGVLLERVRAAGLTLEAAGDRLRISPGDRLPEDLRAGLVKHKAEVLAALADPRRPAPPEPVLVPADAVALRVAAFRAQLATWKASRRPGVPLLALPDLPPGATGCVGCGEPLPAGRTWRCVACVAAVEAVLGLPPVRLDLEATRGPAQPADESAVDGSGVGPIPGW
jgi:hypothetical protein